MNDEFKHISAIFENHEDDSDIKKGPAKFFKHSANPLTVIPLKVNKDIFPKNNLQKQNLVPAHCSSMVFVGATGSGKSHLCGNLLLNKQMLGDFFDIIYLFSPSPDETLIDNLNLSKKHIIQLSDKETIIKLTEIIEKQKVAVDNKGLEKAPKMLLIFEDLSSRKKLMDSQPFIDAFIYSRHISISTMSLIHKYKALNRICRLNCHHLFVFPVQQDEINQLVDDHSPPKLSKKEFVNLINYAFTKTEKHDHPFLYINKKADFKTRYRKCLDTILEL